MAEARVRVKYQWLAASWRRRLLLDAEMSQNWEVETQDDQGRRRSAPIGSALNNVSVLRKGQPLELRMAAAARNCLELEPFRAVPNSLRVTQSGR